MMLITYHRGTFFFFGGPGNLDLWEHPLPTPSGNALSPHPQPSSTTEGTSQIRTNNLYIQRQGFYHNATTSHINTLVL